MSILRLDLESLDVESFPTMTGAGESPAMPGYFDEWTGCMSDCSACGHACMQVAAGFEPV